MACNIVTCPRLAKLQFARHCGLSEPSGAEDILLEGESASVLGNLGEIKQGPHIRVYLQAYYKSVRNIRWIRWCIAGIRMNDVLNIRA